MLGADVERHQRRCPEEESPEPYHQVGGVEVRASWLSVTRDSDRLPRKNVSDEVADCEMLVEWQMRPAKGPAAGNLAFHLCLVVRRLRQKFRRPLAFGIDAVRVKRIGSAGVALRNMSEFGRLFAVDSAGTGQQEFSSSVSCGKLERSLRSGNDRGKHFQWLFGGLLCARFGGGVNDEAEFGVRKCEVADIAGKHCNCRITSKVRTFAGERAGIATENYSLRTKAEKAVHVTEALDEPTAEKPRAAGDEDALAPHLVPQAGRVCCDQVEVFGGNLHGEATAGHLPGESKLSS